MATQGIRLTESPTVPSQPVTGQVLFGVLGPLEVSVGGTPLVIGRGVEGRAASVLAAHAGETVADGVLLDVLYGDETNLSMGRLRTALWRLRRSLGPRRAAIETVPSGHRLDLSVCTTDALLFEELVQQSRAQIGSGQAAAAVAGLDQALALWRGPALQDWFEDPRAGPIAVRLEEMRIGAREDRVAALMAAGQQDRAAAQLQKLIADHPAREHAWVLLIDLLAGSGRTRDAWRAYDEARARLAETGLEPGIELRRSADRLGVAALPAPRDCEAGIDAGLEVARTLPLVGRDAELSALQKVVRSTLPGFAAVVLLEGGAGMGKTRLIAELAASMEHEVPVWYETCDPYLSLPYGPLIRLAQAILAGQDARERGQLLNGPLGRLAAPIEASQRPDDLDSEYSRLMLFEALADLVVSAHPDGMILVLDDAHLAPAPTLQLLRHLLVTRPWAPLTFLLAYRSGSVPPGTEAVLADLQRLASCHRMPLGGIDRDSTLALFRSMVGGHRIDPSAGRVFEITGGNPLHTRALAASPPLDGIFDDRIASLPACTRSVLEMAAVLGQTFHRGTLVAMAREQPQGSPSIWEIADGLDEATRAGLLLEATGVGPGRFEFCHEILQKALYRRLDPGARSLLHLGAGRALARASAAAGGGAGSPDLVAHHFERAWPACSGAEAATHLRRAAERASQQLDFDRAVEYLQTARVLMARDPVDAGGREDAELAIMVGQAYCDGGDQATGRAAFLDVAERMLRAGQDELFAVAAISFTSTLTPSSSVEDRSMAISLLEAAVSRSEGTGPAVRGRVVGLLNDLAPHTDLERSTAEARRARDGYDPERCAALLQTLWSHQVGWHRVAVADELVELGRNRREPQIEANGLIRRWISLIHLGQAGFGDPVGARIGRLVDRAGDPELQWLWSCWRATVSLGAGDLTAAEQFSATARRTPGLVPAPGSLLISPTWVVQLHALQRYQAAFRRSWPAPPASGPPEFSSGFHQTDLRVLRVPMVIAAGDRAAARTLLDSIIETFPFDAAPSVGWLMSAVLLARPCALIGHPGADRVHAALDPHRGRHVVEFAYALGAVDRYLGDLELAGGRPDEAVASYEAAVTLNQITGSRPGQACALWGLAQARRARGAPGDQLAAEDAARAAHGVAVSSGMTNLAALASAQAGAGSPEPAPAPPS